MGFSTFGDSLAMDVIAKAVQLTTDFKSVIGVFVAIAAFGLLIGIFSRFTSR